MKELSTEIEIDADPHRVWSILTDLRRYPEWNPFIPRAEGEVREGARIQVVVAPPGGKAMTFRPTLVRVAPGRELRWLGRLLLPGVFDGEHIFEIARIGDKQVRLTQREVFKGLLVPMLWRGLSVSTRAGFEAMNHALKARAEAQA